MQEQILAELEKTYDESRRTAGEYLSSRLSFPRALLHPASLRSLCAFLYVLELADDFSLRSVLKHVLWIVLKPAVRIADGSLTPNHATASNLYASLRGPDAVGGGTCDLHGPEDERR